MEPVHLIAAVAMGGGATLFMDLWNVALKQTLGIPSLSYCLLGRWFQHMPAGVFRHESITDAPRKPHECAVGWVAHYTIGVTLSLGFVTFVSGEWLGRPTLLPPLLYGAITVVFPFLVMQPAIGLGVASTKARSPWRARLKSVVTHMVFGIGLYVCSLCLSYVLFRASGD